MVTRIRFEPSWICGGATTSMRGQKIRIMGSGCREPLRGAEIAIVHLGAQLLNDCQIRPWDGTRARLAYARYLEAAREYDKNANAWEAGVLVGSSQTLAIGSS